MVRFSDATATFEHAISRAREMVNLYDALNAIRPNTAANDDALRSAYIQAVSSFDFFAHEAVAIESRYRFHQNILTRNISIPMNIITILDEEERIRATEAELRRSNSFKSFVDPSKLAEILSCFCQDPWTIIEIQFNSDKPQEQHLSSKNLKGQLKSIWARRNKIAHEADVDPTLSGIRLWPIDRYDTEMSIDFLLEIGKIIPLVISTQLNS
ncbi:HEPN domain-containing protein [Stappia sp. 28M-7]|uniref:HEPN domain-containing protein n=1 Tax=Stappia sp. 28M-7 TaxID=2762596 RepID=UPI00163BB231|nr:HEPN domain-containing protein [Stappia sp. 28M-7]MBC2859393.1 hypothetical protein [Stappia sp. 28M-7]